jgi:thiamine biosynthesis lipoprotein
LLTQFLLHQGCVLRAIPNSQSAFYFGTSCTLTLYDTGEREIFDLVFARMAEIEDRMSNSVETSELSFINRKAGVDAVKVSEDTFHVIEKGVYISELTQGRFDISVGPLMKLWDIGGNDPSVPTRKAVNAARELVGYEGIELDRASGTVYLEYRGMALDLGGIAKGYAADAVAALLREKGIRKAIVDIGGNILVMGRKSLRQEWRIGIQNPFAPRGAYCGVLLMEDATAVTSGTYERYFEKNGRRYHHILDTGTGYPVENSLASVTVIGENSLMADALATGVFVMGLREGIAFVENLKGIDAIFVTSERRIHLTSGLEERFSVSDKSFTLD